MTHVYTETLILSFYNEAVDWLP